MRCRGGMEASWVEEVKVMVRRGCQVDVCVTLAGGRVSRSRSRSRQTSNDAVGGGGGQLCEQRNGTGDGSYP